MRSVEEQQALVTAAAVSPEPVRVAISEALDLMCAEEVEATVALPGFTQSAIDGYAVRAVDLAPREEGDGRDGRVGRDVAGPAEISLPVVGDVAAGSKHPLRLQPKQAVRVETGAPLPTLADAVLPLSWTDRGSKRMTPQRKVRSGEFVRRVGDDIQPGDVAVTSGSIIGPAQVGLLAAVGRSKVLVHPRPRVSIITFGAELVDIDREPTLGQVYDVNSYALAAAAREAGAEVHRVGVVSGEPRKIREIIESQLLRCEILVISGAVGGAAADRFREVLSQLGELDVSRVAMHPGSVQGFGTLGDDKIPTFLLPSNPVSALVVFEVMVRPLIRISLGKRNPRRRTIAARVIAPVDSVWGRRGYIRGQLMRDRDTGEYLVQPLGAATGAPSHLLAGLAEANCLVMIPDDITDIRPGDVVEVLFLSQRS